MGLWSFWLFLAVGLLVVEIFTLSTVCLYVGTGALIAMATSFIRDDWAITIITFVVSTVVIYAATYKWRGRLVEWLHRESSQSPTGMDALIGRTGTIIKASDSLRIRIDGDTWQVRPSAQECDLHPGEKVRVTGYDSIILEVEELKTNK